MAETRGSEPTHLAIAPEVAKELSVEAQFGAGEPSRGAPDAREIMREALDPMTNWDAGYRAGKEAGKALAQSERTALLEALKRIEEIALRTTPLYAASALVKIAELAEIRKVEQ